MVKTRKLWNVNQKRSCVSEHSLFGKIILVLIVNCEKNDLAMIKDLDIYIMKTSAKYEKNNWIIYKIWTFLFIITLNSLCLSADVWISEVGGYIYFLEKKSTFRSSSTTEYFLFYLSNINMKYH